MDWLELEICISQEIADAVAQLFEDFGSGGVVVEDPRDLNYYINSGLWDCTDLKMQEENGKLTVRAYFPLDTNLDNKVLWISESLHLIKSRMDSAFLGELKCKKVNEENWSNAWKKYFHPTRIGKNIVIKPSWEEYEKKENDLIIEIDPGMAFGTGTHHTTTLCAETLEDVIKPEHKVFDVGTGSGILALICAKLGANEITAIDLDPVAVKVAIENVEKNNLSDKISVLEGDLLSLVDETADIIVANIIADVICVLLPDAMKKLKSGGIFIASGIIADRKDDVINVAKKTGFIIGDIKTKKDWVAITMYKEKFYA